MSLKKLGRYDIIKPLGKGAMGLIYKAHDPNLDRFVAIKTIRVDQLSEDMAGEYESRFRAEARAGGRLQHPNIIGVYDSGRDEGMAYMVMELIRGGDLKQQLDRGARLAFDRSFALMRDLLSALSFAHEQGVIHRDVKPANVMLDSNGRVKLGDFGVARLTQSGDATRTQGGVVGTLKYMSPEQVQGLQVDARTDLFAAGVVLYQLLTGRKPFDGPNDFAIMQAIAQQEPAPPSSLNPGLPAGIDTVVARALAKDRDARYTSARDFMRGLRAVMAQAGGPSTSVLPAAAPSPAAAGERGEASGTGSVGGVSRGTGSGTNTLLPPVSADPSGTSPSALAQEMELVYWKDIQDSSDPVDFQGFLQQFPAGVYAVLAARRLRRLARTLADGTGSQSSIGSSPFFSATVTGSLGGGAAAGGDAVEAVHPAEAVPGLGDGLAPPETAAGDAAQRLAATRAAEEEERWQQALQQEALKKEALERAAEAERARTIAEALVAPVAKRSRRPDDPPSSSFIDLSSAPMPLAAATRAAEASTATGRISVRVIATLVVLVALVLAAWWALGVHRS